MTTEISGQRVVVIHGAGGAIGSAVAREFARSGAQLFLAGHRGASVQAAASTLEPHVKAHVAEIDAYDQQAVDAHTDMVVRTAGRIDVMLNAVGIPLVQGTPLVSLRLEDFLAPATHWLRTQFITARAATEQMVPAGSGTILTLSASPARMSLAGVGGFAAACSAIEAFTRTLAAEVGRSGVRVVCLRPQRIVDTLGATPDLPMPVDEFTGFLEGLTTSGTLPRLSDVARAAVFLAGGGAATMNGAVMNLTCGMSSD
jgi:3-oxoacyl-[acyl-carrier protein] reductase